MYRGACPAASPLRAACKSSLSKLAASCQERVRAGMRARRDPWRCFLTLLDLSSLSASASGSKPATERVGQKVESCHGDQHVDDAANCSHGAEDRSDQIKAEEADQAPIDRADDHEYPRHPSKEVR